MRVALTGHRPQRLGLSEDEMDESWNKIDCWLCQQIIKMLEYTILNGEHLDLYCGMASGCDIKFGLIASALPISDTHIHFVLPCKNYNSSHKYFNMLKENASEWIELSEEFYKGCDNVRDQYMVDNCDVLLAVWDGNKSGGVWSTIRKAQKKNKEIIYCPVELLKN